MKFINTHKKSLIVTLACLVLIVLAFFAIYRMFYPNSSKSYYGERLDGAPAIDSAIIEKIKEKMKNNASVNSVSYNISGRIMKFFIDVKSKTESNKAQDLTNIISENLSETILNFYDTEVYITQKDDDSAKDYPMVGYKSKDTTKFTFVLNKNDSEAGA